VDTYQDLSLAYLERHPAAAAAVLERLEAAQAAPLLGAAPPEVAARVLGAMAPLAASACLVVLPLEAAGATFGAMPPAIAAALLRRVPADRVEHLVAAVRDDRARAIRRLLRYRQSEVGALVDSNVPGLPANQHAADALAWVRQHPDRAESTLFLVDRDQQLRGTLPLQVLFGAEDTATLESLGQPVAFRLLASTPLVAALDSAAWLDRPVVPVVDERGVYLGALRYGTLRHLADAERARTPSTTPIQTLLNLGELYWSGAGRLMVALAAAVTPDAAAGSRHVRSGEGSLVDDRPDIGR
jgi:magnesium transporter